MVRCETLESAAVTADCVTSEVAASERLERERERERELVVLRCSFYRCVQCWCSAGQCYNLSTKSHRTIAAERGLAGPSAAQAAAACPPVPVIRHKNQI